MSYFYIDIETRSELDVTKVGAFAYAEHPSTEVLCTAWAFEEGEVRVVPGPPAFLDGYTYVAHNVDFEREVLSKKVDPRFATAPWLDTAALGARMGLPRDLEELAAFFGVELKDAEGKRVMMQLSKPRRPSKSNPDKWWTPATRPESFERLYAYCAQDVRAMRHIHHRLLPLTPGEQRVWELTDRMNRRGVRVDRASIPLAQAHLESVTVELNRKFRAIVGVPSKSYARVAQKLGLPDVRKPTVRKALRSPALRPEVREALEVYRVLARSSTAKLAATLRRMSRDGRLRGALVYSGAERTARWSSMGVQLQNLPRGMGTQTEAAFDALRLGMLHELFHGEARPPPERPLDDVSVVAEMLRGFFTATPGRRLLVGDYSQIEARVLAWLARQLDLLELFATGKDPYCAMASQVYNKPVTKKDKAERFMGKQLVLGAGYGLGKHGFQRLLDETYDVAVTEEESERMIRIYRHANPEICTFWETLENGFRFALENKSKRIKVGPVFMGTLTVGDVPYLFIELPSGRRMYYARPHVDEDGELRYFGRDIRQGGMWTMVKTYGGKIAENVTQATSRDILAYAMLNLEAAGVELVATVHDEVVADDEEAKFELFERTLKQAPSWANGLPLDVECFITDRYRK